MSHQTGIQPNEKLRSYFVKSQDGSIRLMKITIQNEELVLDQYREPGGSWEDDYNRLVLPLLESDHPCYLLYRLDKPSQTGYEWLFICWSPDVSPVREKMLYASTKATLKMQFGGTQIKDEMFGTVKDDVSLQGYMKHIAASNCPAPLTFSEEELQNIKKSETGVDISIDTRHQTIQGLAMPISDAAIEKLFDMKEGIVDYIQLSIDLVKEEINLESCEPTTVTSLCRRIPKDAARYHLFNFKHSYDGDYLKSIVFIYSMPGYNCSVKERMMYSSCKAPLVSVIEQKVELEITRKVEIDSGSELTEEFLINEIHPKTNIHKQKFAKPKGPPNRGARRITRPPQEEGSV